MQEEGVGASRTRDRIPMLISALSGAASGAVISAVLQPLDVLRTRIQADATRGVLRGSVATCTLIVKEQGLIGLWRGTGPTVIRLSLGAGMHMVFLENFKAMFTGSHEREQRLTSAQAAMAGGMARALAAFVMCPVTVVKTRMEYSGPGAVKYRHTAHALTTIARDEGARGLFRGLGPTIISNAPFSALYYMFYVRLKEGLAAPGRPSTAVNFSSGVLAATAATLLTQPADLLRTRMQLDTAAKGVGPLRALTQVVRQHGPLALFAGSLPRVLKRSLQTALVWTLYEELLPRATGLWQAAQPLEAPREA